MKIAILALGRDSALDAYARSQQQGLATALAAQYSIVLYRAAVATGKVQQRLANRVFRINLWAPGGETLSAVVAGWLAAVHLRLIERPKFAVVLNPWNAIFIGANSARSGVAVSVDNLIGPQQKGFTLAALLGRLLALRSRAKRFNLICHSDAGAVAFEKRFGVKPKVVAPGISPLKKSEKKPSAIGNDPLLSGGFDLFVGSTDQPQSDAQALRAHSRGAREFALVYLPAFDVRQVESDELDDAIGKHGRIRVVVNSASNPLTPWLMKSARVVIAADRDLLGARIGAAALISNAELLVLDSPANRELLDEVAWLWPGEASLANLLTDMPWRRNSRAKLRAQGLKPLTDWRLVAKELMESFEG